MICTHCGKETFGSKCLFCGAHLENVEFSEKELTADKKKKAYILAGGGKKARLNKNGVILFHGRHEGKDSDVSVSFKNIVQLKFVKASGLGRGYLTFCTKTGAGNTVNTVSKAASDKHSLVFGKSKNEEFEEFVQSFDAYMKKANPKYIGILTAEEIVPTKKSEQKKTNKELFARYEKEGRLFCAKCGSLNVVAFNKNEAGINTEVKCRDCAHHWKLSKKALAAKAEGVKTEPKKTPVKDEPKPEPQATEAELNEAAMDAAVAEAAAEEAPLVQTETPETTDTAKVED